ncbi:MAG: hypothetical protein WD994_01610, partial [Pseudomonadales bacterium]
MSIRVTLSLPWMITAILVWSCLPVAWAADVRIRAAEVVAYGVFEAHKQQSFTKRFRSNAPAADTVTNVRFVDFTHDIMPELGTQ